MKNTIAMFVGFFIQGSILCAEDITLVVNGTSSPSQIITLNQGDTARLEYNSGRSSSPDNSRFNIVVDSLSYGLISSDFFPVIAGPATIQLLSTSDTYKGFATFSITRAGIASPPASIPQEAGTTWDVILESSSDLINWTPANPGEYSGTEPKRFFRTRIVKKEL